MGTVSPNSSQQFLQTQSPLPPNSSLIGSGPGYYIWHNDTISISFIEYTFGNVDQDIVQ